MGEAVKGKKVISAASVEAVSFDDWKVEPVSLDDWKIDEELPADDSQNTSSTVLEVEPQAISLDSWEPKPVSLDDWSVEPETSPPVELESIEADIPPAEETPPEVDDQPITRTVLVSSDDIGLDEEPETSGTSALITNEEDLGLEPDDLDLPGSIKEEVTTVQEQIALEDAVEEIVDSPEPELEEPLELDTVPTVIGGEEESIALDELDLAESHSDASEPEPEDELESELELEEDATEEPSLEPETTPEPALELEEDVAPEPALELEEDVTPEPALELEEDVTAQPAQEGASLEAEPAPAQIDHGLDGEGDIQDIDLAPDASDEPEGELLSSDVPEDEPESSPIGEELAAAAIPAMAIPGMVPAAQEDEETDLAPVEPAPAVDAPLALGSTDLASNHRAPVLKLGDEDLMANAVAPVIRLKEIDLAENHRVVHELPSGFFEDHGIRCSADGVILLQPADLVDPGVLYEVVEKAPRRARPRRIREVKESYWTNERIMKWSLYAIVFCLIAIPTVYHFKYNWRTVSNERYEEIKAETNGVDWLMQGMFLYRTEDSAFRWFGRQNLTPSAYERAVEESMMPWLFYTNSNNEGFGDRQPE